MSSVHDTADVGSPEQLAKLDLNLLVAFDALSRERNVTRAAQRTGVTQSAMSHALARLRELLSDPLLVRGRGGMMLTPRAEALVVPLRSGLSTLGRALAQPAAFDAATARRAFRIASPDLFDVLVVPRLLQRICSEAPGIDVVVAPLAERGLAQRLESGELDVAVAPRVDPVGDAGPEGAAAGLLQSRLFRDRFVCFLRADHPAHLAASKKKRDAPRLSLRTFSELSHALISPSGEGPGFVDQLLAKRGLRRRIALRIPHFYAALAIVAKSDLVLTAPARARPPRTGVCWGSDARVPTSATEAQRQPRLARTLLEGSGARLAPPAAERRLARSAGRLTLSKREAWLHRTVSAHAWRRASIAAGFICSGRAA